MYLIDFKKNRSSIAGVLTLDASFFALRSPARRVPVQAGSGAVLTYCHFGVSSSNYRTTTVVFSYFCLVQIFYFVVCLCSVLSCQIILSVAAQLPGNSLACLVGIDPDTYVNNGRMCWNRVYYLWGKCGATSARTMQQWQLHSAARSP